jgi:hypothetical protein
VKIKLTNPVSENHDQASVNEREKRKDRKCVHQEKEKLKLL